MTTLTTMHSPVDAKAYFEDKLAFTTDPAELERLMKANEVNVIDVRASGDFAESHIPGAINLPKDRWHLLEGLRKDKPNVLYCYSHVCHLAATAAVEFAGQGFPVMELEGGWRWWKENGFAAVTRGCHIGPVFDSCICGLPAGSCMISNCDCHLVILRERRHELRM